MVCLVIDAPRPGVGGKSRPGVTSVRSRRFESSACAGMKAMALGTDNANAASVHYATQAVLIGAGLFSAKEKPRRSGAKGQKGNQRDLEGAPRS